MPKLKIDKKKPIVISLGGSMIVPECGPDTEFLNRMDKLVRSFIEKGQLVAIICGGGKTARHYIDAAAQIHKIDPEDLDWIGIHATRLNAHLVRTLFRDIAHPVVIKDPTKTPKRWKGKVLVASGWKPGWSTDYVASRMAHKLGVKNVVNVSNISHVFEEDPRKNPEAKPLNELSWKVYRLMVGDNWHPGKSAPFDPIASKFCQKNKMEVAVASADLENLKKVMSGENWVGTLLK